MCEKPLSCCYLYPIAMKNASALSNPQATPEASSETLRVYQGGNPKLLSYNV